MTDETLCNRKAMETIFHRDMRELCQRFRHSLLAGFRSQVHTLTTLVESIIANTRLRNC